LPSVIIIHAECASFKTVSNLALLQCHVAGVCLINEREGGKQRGTLKNWYPTTTFHSTTTQKTIDSIFTAMETSNLTSA